MAGSWRRKILDDNKKKDEQVSFSLKNADKQKKRGSTSAIDKYKKPSFTYEL